MSKTPTVSAWKKAREHTVLCPSGMHITLKIPDLPAMIEAGQIPQHLLEAALGAAKQPDKAPDIEMVKQMHEYTDHIVLLSVIEPKITKADLPDIPYEDKEFIVLIASRQRDLDAAGDHIAGLSDLESFRRFRKLGEFSEDVEGL